MTSSREVLGPSDRRAVRQLQDDHEGRLERFKESAGKWQAGLAAATTGFSALLVVTGRESFKDLNLEAQVWAGIWIGLAVLFSMAGGFFALKASAGWPSQFPLTNTLAEAEAPGDVVMAIAIWKDSLYETARTSLSLSIGFTYAAVVFLFIAVGVTWYSPDKTSDEMSPCISVSAGDQTLAEWTVDSGDLTIPRVSEGLSLSECDSE